MNFEVMVRLENRGKSDARFADSDGMIIGIGTEAAYRQKLFSIVRDEVSIE